MYFIELLQNMGKVFTKYWRLFLFEGVSNTLLLAAIAVLFGTVIGSLFAIMKLSRFKPLGWMITAIVEVLRGTPALLQLYIGYFLLPTIIPALGKIPNSELFCVAVALSLNSAAYVSEIIRSGIEAVDRGQTEAARCLGLNASVTMMSIVLPQAIKNILPALGNEFITVIKETSLASTFFGGELMTSYLIVKGATHITIPTLMVVGIIYFILNFVLSKLMKLFERRMKAHA